MVICRRCNVQMEGVSSFSSETFERFYKCPRCEKETDHKKINKNTINFGEVLHRELDRKRK